MRIPLTEPTTSRYLYINPKTNQVHLLVPFIAGLDISTDNTCKSNVEIKAFFEGAAIKELEAHRSALAFDISLMYEGNPERTKKEARLAQIEVYIDAIKPMRYSYEDAANHFLARPSNLYSIQLRPREQDPHGNVVNPVFTMDRCNDSNGSPLSPLYEAMHAVYPKVKVKKQGPRTQFIEATLKLLSENPSFKDIQKALKTQFHDVFNIKENFEQYLKERHNGSEKQTLNKADVDELMGFGADATPKDYIDALLGLYAPHLDTLFEGSPFYRSSYVRKEDQAEALSMLTQFYLGVMNVHCSSQHISDKNLGEVLDASKELSSSLVEKVTEAITLGEDVENVLCDFINRSAIEFGLSRELIKEDKDSIQQKFETSWKTVTATKENPHMDDFMILDTTAKGENAKFINHNGLICTDFSYLVAPTSPYQKYFEKVRQDRPEKIPDNHQASLSITEVDIDLEALLDKLKHVQWDNLPKKFKEACFASPAFISCQGRKFLPDVAQGKQEDADAFLNSSSDKQALLTETGEFTDYSGRTFNCTAYEYAYWAKDTHMCHMLEAHMDSQTKADILARVKTIEKKGLAYQQYGKTIKRSKHFDLSPLIKALTLYAISIDRWHKRNDYDKQKKAWLAIGKAQREVPAHVAQEYCREGRFFDPMPDFKEKKFPRALNFHTFTNPYPFFNSSAPRVDGSWFPLTADSATGLGFDFALCRGISDKCVRRDVGEAWRTGSLTISKDLAAIGNLEKVRSEELKELRDHLSPPEGSKGISSTAHRRWF